MKREDFYLSDSIIRTISEINHGIEIQNCRQMKLVDVKGLSKLIKDYAITHINEEYIVKLWMLGLINADVIYCNEQLANKGLIQMSQDKKGEYYYADERVMEEKPEGYLDSFRDLVALPNSIKLLFHPFRIFMFVHINRVFNLNQSPIQDLLNTGGYETLISIHLNHIKYLTSKSETIQLFKYWNNITSLCAISETTSHQFIYNRVMYGSFLDNYEITMNAIQHMRKKIIDLFNTIGVDSIEYYRRELCYEAELLDGNVNLHQIIRLMSPSTRDNIKGQIGGSLLFRTMAECLRRNLEIAFQKEFPEEDETGFGIVIQETKIKTQGAIRLFDGDKLVANQFLRRMGLDYGVRVKVYVEGDTENDALLAHFSNNTSVQVVNLKGQFSEGRRRGIAFRDSLRNDLRSKTFSVILLDGDVSDNYKAVKQAAVEDEICGMIFVANPDFEMQNFTLQELAKIVENLLMENGIDGIKISDIEDITKGAKSAKEFFDLLKSSDNRLEIVSKGGDWGSALYKFAVENPRCSEFGGNDDRQLNQVITILSQCSQYMYEPTRQNYKVDPETGKLVER